MALRTLFPAFFLGMTFLAAPALARDADIFQAQAALVRQPTRPEAYVQLGDLYARQSEADYARFYYELALNIDPQDARAQAGLGKLESNPKASADAALDKQ